MQLLLVFAFFNTLPREDPRNAVVSTVPWIGQWYVSMKVPRGWQISHQDPWRYWKEQKQYCFALKRIAASSSPIDICLYKWSDAQAIRNGVMPGRTPPAPGAKYQDFRTAAGMRGILCKYDPRNDASGERSKFAWWLSLPTTPRRDYMVMVLRVHRSPHASRQWDRAALALFRSVRLFKKGKLAASVPQTRRPICDAAYRPWLALLTNQRQR